MQRQSLPVPNPQAQEKSPFDWQALFENAGVTSLTFGGVGLIAAAESTCERDIVNPALGAAISLSASRTYGRFFQAGRDKHNEQGLGRMLGMGSAVTLFATLAFVYQIDPMATFVLTMVLAASLLALSRAVPHQEPALVSARRPG